MGLALPPFLTMRVNNVNGNTRNSSNGTVHMNNNGHGPSSSESEDWGEESWIVDCPCGVNFDDGDEMVECDECNVWVHTSCCQVSKSVTTYVCDKCKDKKRREQESEVAQLLVELPGKTVSFDERTTHEHASFHVMTSFEMLLGQPVEMPIERKVHEQGVPGGDPSIFVGVSGVFSQQLWKAAGYVPKMLQVRYTEIPDWLHEPRENGSLFDMCRQSQKESPKSFKKPKQEQDTKVDGETQQPKLPDEKQHGKKLEVVRHGKHKHKFRGLKDEKQQQQMHQSKRLREDVKEQYSRKKMKASPEAQGKRGSSQQSPKNPKAMRKTAVQEFMDVDVRICSRCSKPEPITNDDQGSSSKPSVCQECQKSRQSSLKKQDSGEVPLEQTKKAIMSSPETQSTDISKQGTEQRTQHENSVHLADNSEIKEAESADSRQQKPMKPPSTDDQKRTRAESSADAVEQKVLKGCQLSIKTSTVTKSDIPSPASINSGGQSTKEKLLPPPSSTGKPINGKPAVGKSCSASKSSVPAFKKTDGTKTTHSTGKTPSSQPGTAKQQAPGKNSVSSKSSNNPTKKPVSSSSTLKHSKDVIVEESTVQKSSQLVLNDEEYALLLHQALNSSPRVPRVPRVRQAIAQVSSQPSSLLTKRNAPPPAQKERLLWRKRHRDDLKEASRANKCGETPLLSRKLEEGTKTDDEAACSRADSADVSEGANDNAVSSKKHSSPALDADETPTTG